MARGILRTGARTTMAGDRRGGVTALIGIVMVVLIGMVALAIDVSSAMSGYARLHQAADTAALAAVRQAAIDTANNSTADTGPSETAGRLRFVAQSSAIPSVTVQNAAVTVSRQNLTITATVTFKASYATQIAYALQGMSSSFGNLASISLSGRVAAQQTVGAYVDIQVLMDTSNSMAIAATPKDAGDPGTTANPGPGWLQGSLGWATQYVPLWLDAGNHSWPNCTVACHAIWETSWTGGQFKVAPTVPVPNYYADPPLYGSSEAIQLFYLSQMPPGFTPNPSHYAPANAGSYDPLTYDYYALARWLGVTLRIDLLKNSVSSIAHAIATAPDGDKFRFGFYTFDLEARQNYALGAASSVGSSISSVEVTPIRYPSNPGVQTNVAQSIKDFTNSYVAAAGDGSSPDAAKKYAIILTDGVEDYWDGGRQTPVFSSSACDTLKKPVSQGGKGAGVFVLHAASLDNFPVDSGSPADKFNATVAAMQACASDPSYYFLASSPAQIQAATQAIINLALSKATVLTLAPSTTQTTN